MTFCNCCQRPIFGKAGYRCRLGIFEEITYHGQRAALRIGWADRVLCRSCTTRIERAHNRRLAARRSVIRPNFGQNGQIWYHFAPIFEGKCAET